MSQRKSVLVIDDEPDLLEILGTLLRDSKLLVATAKDGKEGLNKCGIQKFDLIITDLRMPNLDGNSFIHELRKKDNFKTVPVIMVSGFFDERSSFFHQNLYCMPKPLNELQLLEVVQIALLGKPLPAYSLGGSTSRMEAPFMAEPAPPPKAPPPEVKPVTKPAVQQSLFPVDPLMDGLRNSAKHVMESLGLKTHCGQRIYIPLKKVECVSGIGATINLSLGNETKKVGLCFEEECFKSVMRNMLMIEEVDCSDEIIEGAGELMNQFVARSGVMTKFNIGRSKPDHHLSLEKSIDISQGNGDVLPFSTTKGKFSVFLFSSMPAKTDTPAKA